jgi:hypothetical protein
MTLNEELHCFNLIERNPQTVVEPWLRFDTHSPLHFLAFHAALLLCSSQIWTVETANHVCDMLISKLDRFRGRAYICLLTQERKSSDFGLEVIQTLTEHHRSYLNSSYEASTTIRRMLNLVTFDRKEHLTLLLRMKPKSIDTTLMQRWASTDFFEYEYEYEYRPPEYEYEYEYWPFEYEYEYEYRTPSTSTSTGVSRLKYEFLQRLLGRI